MAEQEEPWTRPEQGGDEPGPGQVLINGSPSAARGRASIVLAGGGFMGDEAGVGCRGWPSCDVTQSGWEPRSPCA